MATTRADAARARAGQFLASCRDGADEEYFDSESEAADYIAASCEAAGKRTYGKIFKISKFGNRKFVRDVMDSNPGNVPRYHW